MRQKTNQILFAYWNDVRGNRMAPRRFEIEPARIAAILPETFILERLDSEAYVFRLAGTRICEQFGTEFRSTNFLDDWIDPDRLTLARHFSTLAAQGAVMVLEVEAAADEYHRATFEMTLMPLVHTSNSVSRYLGAISAVSPPAWLGTERLWRKRLLGQEIVWPEGRPHPVAERMREPPAIMPSLSGARLVRSERRAFRVLDGGRGKPAGDEPGGDR
jgi:hypothetical protein